MAHITNWKSLSDPNEEWEAAWSKLPPLPDLAEFKDSLPFVRQMMSEGEKAKNAAMPEVPGISVADHTTAARDGAQLACRVYSPNGKRDCPMSLVFHGGGWCFGGLDDEDQLCRSLSSELGCVVVNVDYRLAPEHTFPTALHDCYDVAKWAYANASSLGAHPNNGFIVSGTSAGANMAAAVTFMLRDDKIPVTGTHLMVPSLCSPQLIPDRYKSYHVSREQNKNLDVITPRAAAVVVNTYAPDPLDQETTYMNPMLWPSGLTGFPPTYLQVCGRDGVRDDGLVFERMLREEAGGKTRLDVYPGLPHAFWTFIPAFKASQQFRSDSLAGIKWLLEQKS